MDTNRGQQRQFAAMNNDFLPSQYLQQFQYTTNPEMADPAYQQMMPSHAQTQRQIPDARHHTNENYDTPFPSARYHETPAHLCGRQLVAMNNVAIMQPQHPQRPQHTSDPIIAQAAYRQLMSAQANAELSHAGRRNSPPPSSQYRMPTKRGTKRPFAERGFAEPGPQFQPPPQPESIHHSSLAAHYETTPTYRQTRTPCIQSHRMPSPLEERFHQQQRRPEMRPSYQDYAQQAQQIQTMPFYHQNQPRTPQQTHASNASSIPQQHYSCYGSVDGAQYQIPLQYQQSVTGQMNIGGVQYERSLEQNAAVLNNVASTQHQNAPQVVTSQQLARIYVDQRPQFRDWARQHIQECELFMKFLRACSQVSASIQAPCSPQNRAEVMTVMAVGLFRGMSMRPEQTSTARKGPSIQRLAQQLLIYLEVKAHMAQDVPAQIVAIEALHMCERRGLPFTLPNHLLQAQVPSLSQQARLQQQSVNSNSPPMINPTGDVIIPVSQQTFPRSSQHSGRLASVQIVMPQTLGSQHPHLSNKTKRNDSPRVRSILPTAGLPTANAVYNASQPQEEQPRAQPTTDSYWDPDLERAVAEAIEEFHAQETSKLEQTTTSVPPAGTQLTQSLPEVALTPSGALTTTASPLAPQTPTPAHATPSLSSTPSRPESSTPPTPPALQAAGWCRRSHISPDYSITSESSIQTALTAALAREDAKEDPADQEIETGIEMTDAQWTAAVLHIPILDIPTLRRREREQLAAFIPMGGYDLPSPTAPAPRRQERMFLDFRERAKEAERRDREEPKLEDVEMEIGEGWDGDVVGDEAMEGVFASMVREREEKEEVMWAGLDCRG